MQCDANGNQKIIFFLVPNFSLLAYATAIEPLRLANLSLSQTTYEWCMVSSDGKPVKASNGLEVNVDGSLDEVRTHFVGPTAPNMILVCSGLLVENFSNVRLNSWLRRMHEDGVPIGGLCTGAWVLAGADLLDGKRCAVHWENLPGFVEKYPEAIASADLYEVDGNIYTCAGGTASLDMMLTLIQQRHGNKIATKVCEQALIDRARSPTDRQRMPLRSRLGIHDTKLLFAVELMEANISEPLTLIEISTYAGLSRRQIERLFHKHLGRSPARYYLDLRLDRARLHLLKSDMPVIQVAMACGFVSASHFTKCYRELYGRSPQADRSDSRVEVE